MAAMHYYLEPVPEVIPVELHIDSDHDLDEINEKYEYVTNQIAQEFHKLNNISQNISDILEKNFNSKFMNKNFGTQELIEEQFDNLLFKYLQTKELLKKGREIRFYKEKKEKEIENEKRFARNALAHYGIKPSN
jgi:uncharacterized membrane protein YheB (UPF0754 family)